MPVLELRLTPGESVVAETGQLGWLDDGVEIETTTVAAGADGVFDAALRSLGGGTFFMTRYESVSRPGTVAFPARLPGKIVQVPLGPGRSHLIQRHGFLAGLGNGHAWLELSGELSEYDLEPGQVMRVHPAHVGLVESTVTYELGLVPGIKNTLFGGDGLFLLKLTGPGKIWLQSLSLPLLADALEPYLPKPQQANGVSLKLG